MMATIDLPGDDASGEDRPLAGAATSCLAKPSACMPGVGRGLGSRAAGRLEMAVPTLDRDDEAQSR